MANDFETIWAAHEGADHTRALVDEQDWSLDWDNQPSTYKRYPGAERIELPREFATPMATLFQAAANAPTLERLDLPALAQWLWCAYGISATKTYGEGKILFRRTAPSGGALYPAEVYFFARRVEGLDAGYYHFDVSSFAIERIGGPEVFEAVRPHAEHPALETAPVVAALSAIWWRNAWKYRWRNFRYCNQDLGHVVGNMLMAADCMGLEPTVLYAFADDAVNRPMGFESVTEGVLAFVALNRLTGKGSGAAQSTVPKIITRDELPNQGEKSVTTYDNVEAAKQATLCSDFGPACPGRARYRPAPPAVAEFLGERPLEMPDAGSVACTDLIRALIDRRTSRDYTEKSIAAGDLALILETAYRGYRADIYPPEATTCTMQELFLTIHAVDGIEPGAYYYDKEARSLRLIKKGDFRQRSKELCVDQDCAGAAAACIFQFADLKAIHDTYGARGYRYPLQEGGVTGGRIYAAARSLGIGAGGIGAFWDDECGPFFGVTNPHLRPLYTLTLGYEIEDTRIVDTA